MIIHYDLESFRKKVGSNEIHEPYIVGYNVNDKFRYMAGDDCISRFVDYLLSISTNKKAPNIYINAFNGANFDHYFLFKEFTKRKLKPDKYILNNGSIISFEYKNLRFFDVSKHLTGTLKQNLNSFDCDIQKGDFDHELASRWEDMPAELREESIKYLKGDVMGLKELYDKLNTKVFDDNQINITKFISTSALTFAMWKDSIKDKNFFIQLPTLDQEKDFRESVRGGRTYKSKHKFISKQYDAYFRGDDDIYSNNKKIDFDDIDDYLIDADVVSLYPTAMVDYPYPVGDCQQSNDDQMHGKIGIYYISYETNKKLAHSIGGRRAENKSLKWDLKDSEGWYTSIDIEDMIANGYKVTIQKGWYWDKVEYIFKDYIEDLFKAKEAEAQAGRKGSVRYQLSKLYMNSLYGKMIQRPIYNKSKMISDNTEYWKFWGNHHVSDITQLGDNWIISGIPKNESKEEHCISKPTHLGAFILAYSRRIMVNYMKEANPHFDSVDVDKQIKNDIYYTDTDSLQMHVKNARLMERLGDKSLGGITDDLGDDCKIIKGLWIAPKLYMLEYLKKEKDGSVSVNHHFRGKGLNKKDLNVEAYEKMDCGGELSNTRKFQMKKIHTKRNSKQQDIPQFSIIHYNKKDDKRRLTRVVNSKPWDGRRFINDNDSIPWN
jgi:hypothetical protein